MGHKFAKQIRKAYRKQEEKMIPYIAKEVMQDIYNLPFKSRLKFVLKIIKGG